MLVLADLVGLATAFAIVGILFRTNWELIVASLGSLPMWVLIARLYRLYDQDEERTHHPTTDDLVGVFHLVTVGTWILFIGVRAVGLAHPTLGKAVVFWGTAILAIEAARAGARALSRRSSLYLQRTLIVGAGDIGQRVARKLLRHPEYGIKLVGFVDGATEAASRRSRGRAAARMSGRAAGARHDPSASSASSSRSRTRQPTRRSQRCAR